MRSLLKWYRVRSTMALKSVEIMKISLLLLILSTFALGACAPPSGDMGDWNQQDDTPTTDLEEGLDQIEAEQDQL